MNKSTKIIIFALLVVLLYWPKNSIENKVIAKDVIFEPDSFATAGLMYILDKEENVTPSPDKESDCACNKATGLISYDGGTSKSACKCSIGGKPCGCINCKKNTSESPVVGESVEIDATALFPEYYVLMVTSNYCAPCRQWKSNHLQEFIDAGLEVKELYTENNPKFSDQYNVMYTPSFLFCTKVDGRFHSEKNDKYFMYVGPDFTLEKAKELILKVDDSLHPYRKEGLYYTPKQSKETTLNGKSWATRKEYISHLRSENHSSVKNWPLEKLSLYELKMIHDDDHAGVLGELNGI